MNKTGLFLSVLYLELSEDPVRTVETAWRLTCKEKGGVEAIPKKTDKHVPLLEKWIRWDICSYLA